MQLSSDVRIPDGLLAANALVSEKPHQGVPSWNLALHQGIDERNSTAAIGLRVGQHLNRAWSRYTGKERDAESDSDYFGARYYASTMGRFLSPDWSAKAEPVPYAKLSNPQSLNLYVYAGNNPVSNFDPDGHEIRKDAPNICPTNANASGCQDPSKSNDRYSYWEAQNEQKVQKSIASFPKAPAGARMVLTDCKNKSCNYRLTGVTGTYYVYEHFANDGVAGSGKIGPIGPNDYTTSKTGSPGGYFEDQITAVGLFAKLDQHRFFTISSLSSYDRNAQMFVIIREAGQDHGYEHLYDEVANAPSYVNGISTSSYHQ